jgi:hypothetical protein
VPKSWRAELALALARQVQLAAEETLAGRVSAAKQLSAVMAELDAQAPAPVEERDPVDEIAKRRAARRSA